MRSRSLLFCTTHLQKIGIFATPLGITTYKAEMNPCNGNNIKALFFDIDGTLVSFKTHRIPESAIRAVHKARQKGIKVFIATGRPMPFINNLGDLEYDGIMCVTGALCITSQGQVIYSNPVPKDDIKRLIADSRLHPMPVAFASADSAIVCNLESDPDKCKEVFTLLDIPLPESAPLTNALGMDIMQIIAFFDKENEPRIMQDVLKECNSNRWHPYFSDCVAKGTNKATGIDEICRYYNIDLAQTMAFGDGGNDIAMLKHAGTGVAMGNALDEVKQYADLVTDSVDDNGIANILNCLLLNPELKDFIDNEIIPQYSGFDKAHQEDHALSVIKQSLNLALYYDVDPDMVYTIAAYHDLGLKQDRKTHHLVSGQIIRSDARLSKWFTSVQIETIAQAAEDHRASSDHEPRSIYGKIVAEADRLIDGHTILQRTIQYGLKHYPEFSRDEHIQRALDHLDEKYAEGGYLKLWIPESPNALRLHEFQQTIKDRTKIRELVEQAYSQETESGISS